MDGDRPILRREDDRLGFAPVAGHLAAAITQLPAKEGFVFGIEGRWGSGKSTLINLTIDTLKDYGDTAPEIIAFSPWLVGDRDALLRSLFDELAAAAVKIDPIEELAIDARDWTKPSTWVAKDKHWQLKQKERLKKAIGNKLKAFGVVAGTVGKFAKIASALGLGGAEVVSSTMERGADAAKNFVAGGSISKRKADLVSALQLLSRRIVVFVDDLDRLEPREASEVLRLIRAVADFPNIIYVLSFDPEVVATTLSKAVQVDDGAAFLEKIVQVSFRVPRPEAFDLRRWFQSEVRKLFLDDLTADGSTRDAVSRLALAIDVHGGRYLKTGRDVVRALNALRLHALPVRSQIDIPDAVWLQLVKIGNTKLYDWIEEYLVEVAAISGGASLSDGESHAMAARLEEILKGESGSGMVRAVFELQEFLPGLELDGEHINIFRKVSTRDLEGFVTSRRLGSPHHYRFYYAFAQPSGALPDEKILAFISLAASSPHQATLMFTELSNAVRPQGGTIADVLIDRLEASSDRIADIAIPGVLATFADTLDLSAFSNARGDFGRRNAWESAARTTTELLKRMPSETRATLVRRVFEEGKALGWLTHLFRGEIFSHGHYGDRPTNEDRWLLSADEFSDVLTIMLRRYRETSAVELMRVPNLLSLLYAWKQASGTDETKAWVDAHTATDSELLAFLSRARHWVSSSARGVYYPIMRRDLEPFLDYGSTVRRVEEIASGKTASEADRLLASELLSAIKDGEDD